MVTMDPHEVDGRRIGNIGEAVALTPFVKLGIPVYKPFGDAEAADLVVDINGLKKIQVKASSKFGRSGVSVMFQVMHSGCERVYSKQEADYFALVDLIHDKVFLVENDGCTKSISITFDPTARRTSLTRWEEDYEIDKVVARLTEG